jgi:hypothetical protein
MILTTIGQDEYPFLMVAGVAVAATVGAGLSIDQEFADLARPAGQAERVPVKAQTLGCPESPPDRRQRGEIAGVLPAEPGGAGSGSVVIRPVDAESSRPLVVEQRRGVVARHTSASAPPAAVVTARGAGAAAASGVLYVEADGRQRAGLEAVRCAVPGDRWWFAGVDTTAAARSRLVLVNPTPAVAVVSLRLHGPQGAVETPDAQGIPVAPGTSQVVDLAGYAPGLEAATLQVGVTRGQVVSAVHVQRFSATDPAGSDWLPAALPPSRRPLVQPSPPGRADRLLVVTNAGAGEALVQGRVLDEDGAFTPPALTDLRVDPGATVTVDLGEISPRSATAVQLQSNHPVVAGLATTTPGSGDVAFTATGPTLSAPVALPVARDTEASVLLATMRPGGTRVQVTWHDERGRQLGRETVAVTGTAVTAFTPPPGQTRRAAYLRVSPIGPGDVHAVIGLSGRGGTTTVPLRAEAASLIRPALLPADP